MLRRSLTILSLLAVTFATASFDANYFSNVYYNGLKAMDTSVMGMNIFTQDASGIKASATTSLGVSDLLNDRKLWQDNAFRMHVGTDLLFTTIALRLVSLNILPPLGIAIPSAYLPRGVTNFYNPNAPNVAITLEMLMRHTSTITDTTFDSYRQTTPNGLVSDFTTFCDSYFTTATTVSGLTSYSANQNIWSSGQIPGVPTSYRYARANTALLAYVVNAAILGNPTLVSGTTKDVAGYLQEQLLSPLGMSSTFRRNVDGTFPRTTLPNNMALYTGLPIVDVTTSGTVQTEFYIHPSYPSDYMFFSTTENVGRLVRSLFIDTTTGAFAAVGSQMRQTPVTVTGSSAKQLAQLSQGYGLMYFSGASMCAMALQIVPQATCVLTDRYVIYGSYAVGSSSMWGYFCITVNGATTCTTQMIHYFAVAVGAKDPTMLLGAAALVLSDAVGSSSGSSSGSSVSTSANDFNEGLNGLWVALGTCLVIVFVLFAAYFTEYLVQPAPVPSGVVIAPPPIPQAYGHVEHSNGMYVDGAPGFYHD